MGERQSLAWFEGQARIFPPFPFFPKFCNEISKSRPRAQKEPKRLDERRKIGGIMDRSSVDEKLA